MISLGMINSSIESILLFVWEHGELAMGLSAPFHFLGPAEYVSRQGSRPISFVWRLLRPLPAHLKRESARLPVGGGRGYGVLPGRFPRG